MPLQQRARMWSQHGVCSNHYARISRLQVLVREYRNRWIGRGGPVAWLARSPDLTPLEFFMRSSL
nr:unnamed protein product [Callosobruchus chinensis]